MDFQEAITKFGNSKGIGYVTAGRNYQSYIAAFSKYINKPLESIDNDDILNYQLYMKVKYQEATRALYTTALREFFKFTNGRGWTKINREEITINKVHSKVMPYVVQDEMASLCDMTEGDKVKHLAVKILWLCGPRITELITMRKEFVDTVAMGAIIKNLKHHDHESTKFIQWDEETNDLIKEVMAENDSEWVFYSKQSKSHLTARQVQRWFVEFRKQGITKKITPHAMRRGFVKDNLNIGMPLPHLQQMGGWQSLDALQKYTKRLDNDISDIATESMRKRKALADQANTFKKLQAEQDKKVSKILKE